MAWAAIGVLGAAAIGAGMSYWGSKQQEQNSAKAADNAQEWEAYMADVNRQYQTSQSLESFERNAAAAQWSRDWSSKEAQTARDFNAQQADQAMSFQERMSNTAYQRATADMKAAGLNPMLTISQGGASSPSGSAASSPMPSGASASGSAPSGGQGRGFMAQVPNALGGAVTSAFQGAQMMSSLGQAFQSVETNKAQENLINAQAVNTLAQRDNINANTALQVSQRVSEDTRPNYNKAHTQLAQSQAGLAEQQSNTERYRPDLVKGQAQAAWSQSTLNQSTARKVAVEEEDIRKWGGGSGVGGAGKLGENILQQLGVLDKVKELFR